MCDYSLEFARTREAAVGETLKLSRSNSGTVGCMEQSASGEVTAVCLVPGTFLSVTLPAQNQCHPVVLDERTRGLPETSRAEFIKSEYGPHRDALRFENGVIFSFQQLNGATIEVLDPAVKDIEKKALEPASESQRAAALVE